MSQCSYVVPLRARKRLVRLTLEDEYGIAPLVPEPFALYDQVMPLQPAVEVASRNEDGQMVATPVPLAGTSTIQGMTYVRYFDGTSPDFTKILQCVGLPQDTLDSAWGRIVYAPGAPRSGTLEVLYDSIPQRASGVRGSASLRFDVGQPMRCEFSLLGQYAVREFDTAAAIDHTPSLPPVFKGIDFYMINERTGLTYIPIVKSMAIDFGATARVRDDDRGDSDITEIALNPDREPWWSVLIEADPNEDWASGFRAKDKFTLHLTMYDAAITRMMVCTPLGYTAQLNAVPTYGELDGVTVQELQFQLLENRFIEVELF